MRSLFVCLFHTRYIVGCWGVEQLGGLVPGYPWEVLLRLRLLSLILVTATCANNKILKFAAQIISQKLNMEYWQIFLYLGDPQDLRVMGCYSDLRSDRYSELHQFLSFNSIWCCMFFVLCQVHRPRLQTGLAQIAMR